MENIKYGKSTYVSERSITNIVGSYVAEVKAKKILENKRKYIYNEKRNDVYSIIYKSLN